MDTKAGRPTKYDEAMLPKIIALMTEGASIVEVAADIDVSRDTIYDWCNEESERFIPDFSDTIKRGKALSEAWWERTGRTGMNLDPKNFNAVLWYMNMKNRFGWRDRTDVTTGDKPLEQENTEKLKGIADKLNQLLDGDNANNPDSETTGAESS